VRSARRAGSAKPSGQEPHARAAASTPCARAAPFPPALRRPRTAALLTHGVFGGVGGWQACGVAFSIGRHDSNNLVFACAHLSGRHCTLAPATGASAGDAALVLTDTSTNGTFVDGSKVHKDSAPLRWGQRVEVVKGYKVMRCMRLRVPDVRKGVPCKGLPGVRWLVW